MYTEQIACRAASTHSGAGNNADGGRAATVYTFAGRSAGGDAGPAGACAMKSSATAVSSASAIITSSTTPNADSISPSAPSVNTRSARHDLSTRLMAVCSRTQGVEI